MKIGRLFVSIVLIVIGTSCHKAPSAKIVSCSLSEGDILSTNPIELSFTVMPDNWMEKGLFLQVWVDSLAAVQIKSGNSVSLPRLSAGSHTLFAVLCRRDGRSLRAPGSTLVRNFFVGQESVPLVNHSAPLLIVNQPQKTIFRGDEGLRILFDFIVINAELGTTHRVHYNLDGIDRYLDADDPIWIEDARRIGTHDLTVQLETADGSPDLSNPFNKVTKQFLVREK